MVFGRKDKEAEMLEAQLDYQIINQTLANDAVLQQMRREFGPETYIVKDEWLDQILLDLAFELEHNEDGSVRIKRVKNHFFVGLYFLHSSISQTSWIDKWTAEYLKALVRRELYKEYLRVKMNDEFDAEQKSRMYSLLNFLEAYFVMTIESTISGSRVQALKVQPRIVRTEIARRKEKKRQERGLL